MSKTPVSMLQEYLICRGSPPLYKLVYDQGGTHHNLFKYQVSVGELSAIGSGSSKKEAKHDAARILLERLQVPVSGVYHPAKKGVRDLGEEMQVDDVNESVMSEGEDNNLEFTSPAANSIGKLNDALRSKSLPLADFNLTGEEGPPHEKLFTITCTVSKLKESATARTKKMAKHLAAEKMLARLCKTMPDVLTPKPKPQTQEPPSFEHPLMTKATNVYCELKRTKKPSTNPSLIAGYHLALIDEQSETLSHFAEGMKFFQISDMATLQQQFEKIMAELDMTYEFVNSPFERQILPLDGRIFKALRMKGIHEDSIIGFGSTEDEAKRNLLHQAIQFLMNMML